MAHVDHFNKQSVRNIIKEHERDTDHYKNDVDVSRSNLNFGYGHQTADDMALNIHARCNDIMQGRKMQDQTNVMSEWKITYPSWLCTEERCKIEKTHKDGTKYTVEKTYHKPRDPKHVKQFFDTVYNFTVKRYGADNVMGGYVHMDETTPHIHIDLVPEATSRKTGKKTVSSASLFDKKELRNYQRDLQAEMVKVFGKDASMYILNGRTVGDYTIDELKERSRVSRKQKAREKSITEKEQALDKREQALNDREDELSVKETRLQAQEDALQDERDKLYAEVEKRENEAKNAIKDCNAFIRDVRENEKAYKEKVKDYVNTQVKDAKRQEQILRTVPRKDDASEKRLNEALAELNIKLENMNGGLSDDTQYGD